MAIQYTANIKFDRIIDMGIIVNSNKQTLGTIYNSLRKKYPGKEVYLSNCGFFNMSGPSAWTACFGLKANNAVYSDGWNYGFLAFQGNKIKFGSAGNKPTAWANAVTGYPVLIENGSKSKSFSHIVDNSDRGRTMLGYTKDSVILSVISDSSGTSDFTLDEELNYMLMMKCQYAINLDGGGSSQCNFNGKVISSSRKVHNLFFIIADIDMSTPERQVQAWLNANYNSGLEVDGLLGPATKKAIIKAMQKECKVDADGIWGAKSKAAFKYIGLNGPNNTNAKITLIQCALCRKGFWNTNLSTTFDSYMKTQVIAFQKSVKLSQDGIVGKDTITALFK